TADTAQFTADAPMSVQRFNHTATLLTDGRVLVAGGTTTLNQPTKDSLIYDPAQNTFAVTGGKLLSARTAHAASLLPSGDVLVTAGLVVAGFAYQPGEIWSASTNAFTPLSAVGEQASQMTAGRAFHTSTTLASGDVLVTGGVNASNGSIVTWDTAEIYQAS